MLLVLIMTKDAVNCQISTFSYSRCYFNFLGNFCFCFPLISSQLCTVKLEKNNNLEFKSANKILKWEWECCYAETQQKIFRVRFHFHSARISEFFLQLEAHKILYIFLWEKGKWWNLNNFIFTQVITGTFFYCWFIRILLRNSGTSDVFSPLCPSFTLSFNSKL